ncbi:MAG: phosphatase PAP2 family protein [Tenericutes bacterium]|nr:phosphatase PAP2 family protein [Mycoplasmatota bacterium]
MNFELEIIHWLQSLRSTLLDFFFEASTMLGEEVVLICVLGFIYWCYDKAIGEKIGIIVFISVGINSLFKLLIMRNRPYVVDSSIENLRPTTSGSYSFPSGHTQTASTLFFSIYCFLKKKWLLTVAIIITVLVAISRMYIGVHYLTDVLAGAALGILLSFVLSKYLDKTKDYKKLYTILLILVNVSLIAIWIIYASRNTSSSVLDASQFFFDTESVTKMFGTITGFILAIAYEKKKVNFSHNKSVKNNILRFVIGIAVIMAVRYALSFIFGLIVDTDALLAGENFKAILGLLLDYIRYATMLFVAIGLYPLLFKKYNF